MRLSVLIDKLALRTKCEWSHLPDGSTLSTSLPSYRPIYLPWGVSVPVPVAKTLCQPISHVVRGLSRHWIEQRIALDRSDLSFSIPAPGNDSWATLMPTGSRPAQINNIQKKYKKIKIWFKFSTSFFFIIFILIFMWSLWAISTIAYNRLCFYDSAARFW